MRGPTIENTKNDSEKVIDFKKKTEEKGQAHRERAIKALLKHADKLGW